MGGEVLGKNYEKQKTKYILRIVDFGLRIGKREVYHQGHKGTQSRNHE
jgi:hypothetical protein